MKTTYKRVLDFNAYAERLFQEAERQKQNQNEKATATEPTISESKEFKAIEQIVNRLEPIIYAYNERIRDLRLEYANTDANRSVLYADREKGEYQYTKEGLRELWRAVEGLLQKETAEFEPFHLEPSKDVSQAELELLTGFIYREPSETII